MAAYLHKRLDLSARADGLRDGRLQPQIATRNVWLSALLMFVLRLGSFNALEQQLRRPRVWERWTGTRKPSADTIGRVLSLFSLPDLRSMLVDIHRDCWRSKSIHMRPGESYRVVALDSHELWSSRSRCCGQCLQRQITAGGQAVTEYYHRAVAAQWIGVTPAVILDWEMIKPGEGEVVAARRLVDRILSHYSRLIDVFSVDALYLEAGFFEHVIQSGKHVIAVMKQEARELYRDAGGLRQLVPPQIRVEEGKTTRLWDLPQLDSFTTLGRPVRVVWAEEQNSGNRVIGGKREPAVIDSTWIWVTTLPDTTSAFKIQQWGHDRWDIENRGFNELSELWGMDHPYIHNVTAIETLLLTLALAFLITFLFYQRNIKPEVRQHLSRKSLVILLIQSVTETPLAFLWPGPSG